MINCKKGEIMKMKFGIILLAILAVSALSITAGAYANPFLSTNTIPNATANPANPVAIQQSYVRVDGKITEWGTTPVSGAIQVQSRTKVGPLNTIQGFSSTAVWTTNTSRPIAAVKALENFTYTFYAARLVAGNYSALDFNNNAFYMNGTWNVWNITESVTITTDSLGTITNINRDQNLAPLVTQAYGEFSVALGWSNFTLAITGINPVTGPVIAEMTTSRIFNPFLLGTGTSTTVTPGDLNTIASAYGSIPGYGNYNINYDPCGHYKVDICDLATAAANLNSGQ